MKLQVNIHTDHVQVRETITGENEQDIWQQARKEVEKRAPFLARTAIRLMSDQALWARVTRYINEEKGLQEPAPTSAKEFIDLGLRTGYIQRLD